MRKKLKPKTQAQIDAEIALLESIKDKVRATTTFGDDNRKAIRAQIDVLKGNLSNDKIYDKFEPYYSTPEEDEEPELLQGSQHELDSAIEARQWIDGESAEGLCDNWLPLVTR